jgi:hypothetical protein
MLPPSRADLSTPHRELANEDWLRVETTGRRVWTVERKRSTAARVNLSTPSPQARTASTSCKPLRDASPPHFDRAVMRGAGGPPLLLAPPDPRLTSRCQSVATSTLRQRRDALPPLGKRPLMSPTTGCPVTPVLPPRFENAADHDRDAEARNPSRELPRPALPLPSTLSVGYTTIFASYPTKTAACQQRGDVATFAPKPGLPGLASVCTEPDSNVAIGAAWLPPVRPSREMGIGHDHSGTRGAATARKRDTTQAFGDLATCSGARQVRTSSGLVKVSARRRFRVSTVPTERHAPQKNPRETSALRGSPGSNGPRPTFT